MWIDKIIGDIGDKKKYLAYKARVKKLPIGYHTAAGALERYLLYFGPSNEGKSLIAMLDDLADLLEQSVAADMPLRDVVGADPVEFAEVFLENYGGGSWIRKEHDRLRASIDSAARQGQGE